MHRYQKYAIALASAFIFLLGASACSAPPSAPLEKSQEQAADWPRTLSIPAGNDTEAHELTIESEPQRIATLDYESTEVIAELGRADHLVLIPEAVLNETLGTHTAELSEVPATFPTAAEVEAETVIAANPDLVMMSPRHGNEAPIASVLSDAGIQVLTLPESWGDSTSLLTNIELIGQAIGAAAESEDLAASLTEGLAGSERAPEQDADDAKRPQVLLLTNQAGRPFVTAGEAYPVELLERAGAHNMAADLGMHRTGPIGAEQLVQADPDGIVLIDMVGSGDLMFEELLENPAVAALPAVAHERILRVQGKQVQALGLMETVQGLDELTKWVRDLETSH